MSRLPLLAALVVLAGTASGAVINLEEPSAWSAHPADGVELQLSDDDGALRLDFDFEGGGYAIARRNVSLDLPENYAIRFKLKGDAPVNHLELKLVDAGGENVWWHVRRDVQWPTRWHRFVTKMRHISFAWGPDFAEKPQHVAAIEFAVTAGQGGKGTLWIDDMEVVPLPLPSNPPPPILVKATSAAEGHPAGAVRDADAATYWTPTADDRVPMLTLDLQEVREYGGVTLHWGEGGQPAGLRVEISQDGGGWGTIARVPGVTMDRSDIYLPETESRFLRVRLPRDGDTQPRVTAVELRSLDWSASRDAFFSNLAREARSGLYPPGFQGEPTTWTVVGVDHDSREGLLGAGGAVEAGPGQFSVEPFLWTDGRLQTWHDGTRMPDLIEGDLPLPQVVRAHGPWRLKVTALGTGEPEASALLVRYRLENTGDRAAEARLFLAVRPFQVNPPVQFLNIQGGEAPIASIGLEGDAIVVDGVPRVTLLEPPDAFGARPFAGGDVVLNELQHGRWPADASARDDFRAASAVAAYDVSLAAGAVREIDIWIPLHPGLSPGKPGAEKRGQGEDGGR